MKTGVITKFFEKEGYGLILEDTGEEHFFYTKDIEKSCPCQVQEGLRIDFDPSQWNHYHAVHLCREHKELESKIKSLGEKTK